MNLKAFAWHPASTWTRAKIVAYPKRCMANDPSPIEMPDFVAGDMESAPLVGWDAYGWKHTRASGAWSFEHGQAPLTLLHDASVQRLSLGRARWHIVLADGVCAQDSYHDGLWVGPHIGDTVRIGLNLDTELVANIMDDAPVDARVKQPCVLIGHFWAENYAHTLLETASRFWAFDSGEASTLAKLPIIWDLNTPWQKEIAGWLVDDVARIKSLPHNRVAFDQLYVPSFHSPWGSSKASVEWLRDKLKAPPAPGKRRLYISRADAKERRILNEEEVIEALKPMGFEALILTGKTMAEQRDLFREAEVVVMPHGAGCANMIFSGRGTKIVEMVPKSYQHHMFWHIAKWSGHWYGRIVLDDGPAKDMRVEVPILKAALSAAGL